MKLVYIAHPFDGKQENIDKVQAFVLDLALKLPDHTFYSPLHATGFLYEELSYLDGMEHCFEVLGRCDELWLWCVGSGLTLPETFKRQSATNAVRYTKYRKAISQAKNVSMFLSDFISFAPTAERICAEKARKANEIS